MEIERKFLVRRLPEDWERFPKRRLEQAYLSTEPVIRVRRSTESGRNGETRRESGQNGEKSGWSECRLTVKGQGLLAREELELPLTEEAYVRLAGKAEGSPIAKDRYRIPHGDWTIELDVFAPPFAPLILAEVEFPTEAAAKAFQPPDWFGQEVTYDPAYTNAALSRRNLMSFI